MGIGKFWWWIDWYDVVDGDVGDVGVGVYM